MAEARAAARSKDRPELTKEEIEARAARRINDMAHLDLFMTWQGMKGMDQGLSFTEISEMPADMLHDFRIFFSILGEETRRVEGERKDSDDKSGKPASKDVAGILKRMRGKRR